MNLHILKTKSQLSLPLQSLPVLGHLHPEFVRIMDEVKLGLQYAFQTQNRLTLALSATGHAAMECVMANLVEDGDRVLIASNGIWGQRAADMARRQGETMMARKTILARTDPFLLFYATLLQMLLENETTRTEIGTDY